MDFASYFGNLGLFGVALSAFLSSTILPGTSEAAVIAYEAAFPGRTAALFLTATLMNTAGAMTSWALGRFISEGKKVSEPTLAKLRRFGTPLLFFSWVPVIGDALSLGAGLIRTPFIPALLFTLLGKGARYAAILGLFSLLKP